jgi:hypothetical protein
LNDKKTDGLERDRKKDAIASSRYISGATEENKKISVEIELCAPPEFTLVSYSAYFRP